HDITSRATLAAGGRRADPPVPDHVAAGRGARRARGGDRTRRRAAGRQSPCRRVPGRPGAAGRRRVGLHPQAENLDPAAGDRAVGTLAGEAEGRGAGCRRGRLPGQAFRRGRTPRAPAGGAAPCSPDDPGRRVGAAHRRIAHRPHRAHGPPGRNAGAPDRHGMAAAGSHGAPRRPGGDRHPAAARRVGPRAPGAGALPAHLRAATAPEAGAAAPAARSDHDGDGGRLPARDRRAGARPLRL
ncbi:MAG: DNA-binding response regulator KdpE, partial [uncultured Ramlibacter sp.]